MSSCELLNGPFQAMSLFITVHVYFRFGDGQGRRLSEPKHTITKCETVRGGATLILHTA